MVDKFISSHKETVRRKLTADELRAVTQFVRNETAADVHQTGLTDGPRATI